MSVRLDAVDGLLRRSGISPEGLAAAVVALTGPVELLGPARAEEQRAWQQAYAPSTLWRTRSPRSRAGPGGSGATGW